LIADARKDDSGRPTERALVSALDDDVQFSVYRPRHVRPARWYSVIAFAHKTTPIELEPGTGMVDPLQLVEQQARSLLRDEAASFAKVVSDSSIALASGTELLFEPWLDGVDFNPLIARFRWEEPVHHAQFRFQVPTRLDGRRLAGGLRIFAGVILVGEVTFQIQVDSTTHQDVAPEQLPVNRYRKIFASYSHLDVDVVRAVAAFGELTGDSYYIDVLALRSGERWEHRLGELIDDADIFQLFWSTNAMRSAPVLQEVEYALRTGREGFIRPIRWEEPLPADKQRGLPPAAILQLHFSWLPTGKRHQTPSMESPTFPRPPILQPPPDDRWESQPPPMASRPLPMGSAKRGGAARGFIIVVAALVVAAMVVVLALLR
jgi:hypothetical protein